MMRCVGAKLEMMSVGTRVVKLRTLMSVGIDICCAKGEALGFAL